MRNVVVTGGSRGLGLGIAERLSASGFCVIAIARRQSAALEAAIEQTSRTGIGALHSRPFDLSNTAEIADLIKALRRDFGTLYGLVNNAALGDAGVLATMPDKLIEQLVQLNVASPALVTKYTARSMMTGDGGRIVNIASVTASTGYAGLSVYSATKASMLGFTRALGANWGRSNHRKCRLARLRRYRHDARTDSRAARTDRAPQRVATDGPGSDVANTVDFLFSERARNITGTV